MFTRSQIIRGPWTCPTCNDVVTTAHCPVCGERAPDPRDLTAFGLARLFARTFIEIDGRMIRTFRYAVMRPGALTLAFHRGQRKPYLTPVQLFFIANVMFFAMQSFTGAKIFSTPLAAHLGSDIWGRFAETLLARHLQTGSPNRDRYAAVFDQAVAINSKSLIILMALSFALLLPIVFFRSRPIAVHVVFSLHLYAFVLLLFCLALTVVGIDTWFGGKGLDSLNLDHGLFIMVLLACAAYLYKAIGTVYEARGAFRLFKVIVLTLAIAFIILAYRFVLLPITLYST